MAPCFSLRSKTAVLILTIVFLILFIFSYVRDATAGIAVAFSMFNFPAKKPNFFDFDENEDECNGNDGKLR